MTNEFCDCNLPVTGPGCGKCGVCEYCKRRVNAAVFCYHGWNHGKDRYVPLAVNPSEVDVVEVEAAVVEATPARKNMDPKSFSFEVSADGAEWAAQVLAVKAMEIVGREPFKASELVSVADQISKQVLQYDTAEE